MPTWVLGLLKSALFWKVVGGIAVFAGISYGIHRYGTAQWQRGAEQQQKADARELDRQLTAQREAAERALAAKDAAIEDERKAARAERLAIDRARREMEAASAKRIEQILSGLGKKNAASDAVPDSALDDTLRALSARLPDPR